MQHVPNSSRLAKWCRRTPLPQQRSYLHPCPATLALLPDLIQFSRSLRRDHAQCRDTSTRTPSCVHEGFVRAEVEGLDFHQSQTTWDHVDCLRSVACVPSTTGCEGLKRQSSTLSQSGLYAQTDHNCPRTAPRERHLVQLAVHPTRKVHSFSRTSAIPSSRRLYSCQRGMWRSRRV